MLVLVCRQNPRAFPVDSVLYDTNKDGHQPEPGWVLSGGLVGCHPLGCPPTSLDD